VKAIVNAKISIFYEIETFGVLKCRMKDDFLKLLPLQGARLIAGLPRASALG